MLDYEREDRRWFDRSISRVGIVESASFRIHNSEFRPENYFAALFMLESFFIISCVLYLLEYSALRAGIARVHALPRVVPASWPAITVLVAARNEGANIGRCLTGLLKQDYPADRMQIIAVNDDSEDTTLAVMRRIAREHPGRLTIVNTAPEETHARGKARAIAQGMDHATGEIILLTDADCVPPATWARSVVEYFTPDVDVCGGFTVISAHDLFSAAQQLDWLHLQTIGSAALALGYPVGVIGNNFSFRREAYESVGGYRGVPFTVTEDFALFQAMAEKGYRSIFPCDYQAQMFTLPCATMRDMLRQKHRWARGGMESTIPGYMIFVVGFLMLAAFSIAPFTGLKNWIVVWTVKFACDLMVFVPNMRRLRCVGQLRFFLLFEFYFVAQVFVTPIFLMNKTVIWKGRAYR
jgi:cellulose synthase/poly-beta-1,6-N-acetylglucosamine synthase-like glycosyltransferase